MLLNVFKSFIVLLYLFLLLLAALSPVNGRKAGYILYMESINKSINHFIQIPVSHSGHSGFTEHTRQHIYLLTSVSCGHSLILAFWESYVFGSSGLRQICQTMVCFEPLLKIHSMVCASKGIIGKPWFKTACLRLFSICFVPSFMSSLSSLGCGSLMALCTVCLFFVNLNSKPSSNHDLT